MAKHYIACDKVVRTVATKAREILNEETNRALPKARPAFAVLPNNFPVLPIHLPVLSIHGVNLMIGNSATLAIRGNIIQRF